MSTLDAELRTPATDSSQASPSAALAGDPNTLGLPSFIVGSVALGLALVGMVPAASVGATLPVILAATSVGLFTAAVWAAVIGQSAVASVYGIFSGFWLSYAVLVLGLTHNWFGVAAGDATAAQELFLTTWLVVIVMLTLATLRLPLGFTALFTLIDLALLILLIGTAQTSTGMVTFAGYIVLAFATLGVYLYFGSASTATGGKALPLGRPVMRS
jgi:succinate-acetate transporter protein